MYVHCNGGKGRSAGCTLASYDAVSGEAVGTCTHSSSGMGRPSLLFYHDGRHPLIYMYEPPITLEQYQQAVDELTRRHEASI